MGEQLCPSNTISGRIASGFELIETPQHLQEQELSLPVLVLMYHCHRTSHQLVEKKVLFALQANGHVPSSGREELRADSPSSILCCFCASIDEGQRQGFSLALPPSSPTGRDGNSFCLRLARASTDLWGKPRQVPAIVVQTKYPRPHPHGTGRCEDMHGIQDCGGGNMNPEGTDCLCRLQQDFWTCPDLARQEGRTREPPRYSLFCSLASYRKLTVVTSRSMLSPLDDPCFHRWV